MIMEASRKRLAAAAGGLGRLVCAALTGLILSSAPQLVRAEAPSWWSAGMVGGNAPAAQAAVPSETAEGRPDYEVWGNAASLAEELVADPTTRSERLEDKRGEIVKWREQFSAAQSANAARIATLKDQIAALGEAPAEGASEPEEIATRRKELAEALATAQAPVLTAEEAYRRADGLVREIDVILRSRDASELLRHSPAPINPANWPAAVGAVTKFATDLAQETRRAWNVTARREALLSALPLILGGFALAVVLVWQGRRWIERLIIRFQNRLPRRWWGVIELPLSLAQIIIPMASVWFLSNALLGTNFLGPRGAAIVSTGLPNAVLLLLIVFWIGRNTFPSSDRLTPILLLSPEHNAEARMHVAFYGLLLAAQTLITQSMTVRAYGEGVSLATYPFQVLTGLLLFRLGQILRRSALLEAEQSDGPASFRSIVLSLLSKAAMAIGIIGPALGAMGYLTLGEALVGPAMATLGLLAIVALLQRLVYDLYALITRSDQEATNNALFPVLVSFALALLAAPALALIWGMRSADLLEYWTSFREGFQLGDSRISPVDFLVFLVVFALGYGLTQLLLRALQGTILPKTRLDTGGKNAVLSGTRYLGLFLAGLAAITSTGLDLSSLAIVAGALSVGIGFGLQNIVQNFVSGIILLIERPVAEGDWVEVGGVQGIVRGISIRSTRVETFDRTTVIVPNASLISGQVTNVTGFTLAGRLIIPVTVSLNNDPRKVERILREIAEAQPMVILTPPPSVPLISFGAGVMNFEIRMVLRDINFGTGVKSEILHQMIQRFAEEEIEIPAVTREVRTFVQVSQEEIDAAVAMRAEAEAAAETEAEAGARPLTAEAEKEPSRPTAPKATAPKTA